MQAQPMICVRDVSASSRWYQAVLGCQSGHGGSEYEQVVSGGHVVLQLHRWDAQEHPHLGTPGEGRLGHGVALWFQTDVFDDAQQRIAALGAKVLEPVRVNPFANHREVWLADPDGYVVVIAGRYGDLGGMAPAG